MQIVNGYICQTSCDVSAARAGHDPKNPRGDPVKEQQLAEQRALASGRPAERASALRTPSIEAVVFGGNLTGSPVASRTPSETARLVDRMA